VLAAVLIVSLGLAGAEPMAPSLSADLDGDASADKATAEAQRGAVRLRVSSGATKKAAAAAAPAPAADVVNVSLTAAPLGSVGSLLEVLASTDASECLSVWRYHDGALNRIPIRGAGGLTLPDCAPPGEWTHRWERPAPDAPSSLVRERTITVDGRTVRRREVYAFAGFSLDLDRRRSTADVGGLPIPAWYQARFYTPEGLERLYTRFDLAAFRATPYLEIVADRDRGLFTLRFVSPSGEIFAPVESYSAVADEHLAFLVARAGDKTVHARIQLAGDGSVPIEVRVDGLGPGLDGAYAPAGSWHRRGREVFPTAADEIASEHLTGTWSGPRGATVRLQYDGSPPYRLKVDEAVYAVEFDHPAKAAELTLVPTDGSRRGWGVVLKGPNALERFPLSCEPGSAGPACQAEGPAELLRRMGARINVN
jgi:hypothetical protein